MNRVTPQTKLNQHPNFIPHLLQPKFLSKQKSDARDVYKNNDTGLNKTQIVALFFVIYIELI